MAKIFVHIGLPKTATTTLQSQLFSNVLDENIRYLGVMQPRIEDQSPFYTVFYRSIMRGDVDATRIMLDGLLQDGQSILISEELILVSEKDADWRTKLRNLAAILRGFDYTLILTVREPSSAIYSYYVERYKMFSKKKASFLQIAKHDEGMEIYHYRKLTDELFEWFDRERIVVKKFEDIIAGEVEDLCELLVPSGKYQGRIHIQNSNARQSSVTHVYTGKKKSMADIIRNTCIKIGVLDWCRIKQVRAIIRPIISIMERFPLWEMRVEKPDADILHELRVYLASDTAVLKDLYGIKYE